MAAYWPGGGCPGRGASIPFCKGGWYPPPAGAAATDHTAGLGSACRQPASVVTRRAFGHS